MRIRKMALLHAQSGHNRNWILERWIRACLDFDFLTTKTALVEFTPSCLSAGE